VTPAVVAAMFREFANQIDAELAAGTPAKKVAQVCADLAREYAREAISGEWPGVPRD
jgi:hypothetical protein